MIQKGMTKVELENEISKWGEYVQIDNLTRFLKTNPDLPTDIKKFIHQKLIQVYEKRKMFFDAARSNERISELCTNLREQIEYLTKAIECYIKANDFDKADFIIKKILSEAGSIEMARIKSLVKEFYRKEIERCINERRRSNVLKIYERLLWMNLHSEQEKNEIKEKLLALYMEFGMMQKYNSIKNMKGRKENRSS